MFLIIAVIAVLCILRFGFNIPVFKYINAGIRSIVSDFRGKQ